MAHPCFLGNIIERHLVIPFEDRDEELVLVYSKNFSEELE